LSERHGFLKVILLKIIKLKQPQGNNNLMKPDNEWPRPTERVKEEKKAATGQTDVSLNTFTKIPKLEMPSKTPEREEQWVRIEIPGWLIPKGAELVEAYLTKTELIVCGEPIEDDESHNCDQMGCSSVSHIIHRFNLDDSYERKFREDRR
jgi:hypothetical protein